MVIADPIAEQARRAEEARSFAALTPAEWSRRSGVSKAAISRVLNSERGIGRDLAKKLAKGAGIRSEYLLLIDDQMTMAPAPRTENAPKRKDKSPNVVVRRLLRVAAGEPVFAPLNSDLNIVMDRRILESMTGAVPEEDSARIVFAALVKGDSMVPLINDGDTLIVKRYYPPMRSDPRPRIEDGKIYLINMAALDHDTDAEAKVAAKRLFVVDGGRQILVQSENAAAYPTFKVDLRRLRLIQSFILGQPVNLMRAL